MSDAAGRDDRVRDLPGRSRTDVVGDVRRHRTVTCSPHRAGAPGLGVS